MRYEAYLGASKKEIEDFYVGGKQVEELWDGDTLLWKKGYIIKENIAQFCGYSKCVSENGTEVLAVNHKREATDVWDGRYLELFTGEPPYTSRLLEINNNEGWRAVCFENYFYAIRYETIRVVSSEYIIKSFCKFDENGNIIYRFENTKALPIDKLEEFNLHKHSHYLTGICAFYVINDTFYLAFGISSTNAGYVDELKEDHKLAYLVAYKNGASISQKVIFCDELEETINGDSYCKNQFLVDGRMVLAGLWNWGEFHYKHPLVEVTDSAFTRLSIEPYQYLGTNGKDIFFTNDTYNNHARNNIYIYKNGEYKLIYNVTTNELGRITAITFIDNIMYIATNYGHDDFPDSAIVASINLESPEKAKAIYKLNRPKKKFSWAGIRQLTSKNGSVYVHKEYQELWTDGDYSKLEIDEIIIKSNKKGDTK